MHTLAVIQALGICLAIAVLVFVCVAGFEWLSLPNVGGPVSFAIVVLWCLGCAIRLDLRGR